VNAADFDTVSITLDVDWAPEEAIRGAAGRLEAAGLRATFFATHESAALAALDPDRFEVGLHPNFDRSGDDHRSPIATLKSLYPAATGARSHDLFTSSRVLALYREQGLSYEANIFLPWHLGLHPVLRFEGLVSIPFNWSDDKHLEFERTPAVTELPLGRPGLTVLNFHPIHVAMNTRDLAHYAEYKPHYTDWEALADFAGMDGPGIGTLFDELVDHLAGGEREVLTLTEVQSRYLALSSARS
jgi:hypothetical protein